MNKKIVHSVFEHIAATFPDNNAVEESSGACITYRELNRDANIIGTMLAERGIGRDKLVGVLLPTGIAYTAAILGVIKTGGLFMPLELGLPRPRLNHILSHTTPSVIVTDEASAAELQGMLEEFGLAESTRLLVMEGGDTERPNFIDVYFADGQWSRTAVAIISDGSNLPLISEPDDSCYVIYTSGSTGVPKFIEGWHKGLAHYCHWQSTEFALNQTSRISQMAPVTFEASLKDFFVALCSGATLCIPSAQVKENPARLIEWIESSRLTLFQTVPSYLRLVIREAAAQGKTGRFPHLKLVFQSGDTLYGKDVMQWRQTVGGHAELVNLYGPAEVTLLKTFHRIPAEELKPNEIVPIGKPISNTAILIMNGTTLCPPGKIGEICVKSPFIVKGYYRSPELTAEKFVQNPLNPDSRDIIYRTGDLGRYRQDMTIEFVGRMDSQVKVHGNRIELAEIETVLLSFPKIGQVVVISHRTEEMENILACYYTEQEPVTQGELRELILSRLPDYMVPAYFIRMETLPLSLNGKVDRKALPKPEELVITAYEAPQSDTEKGLAEIWSEVLGLGRIGVGNKFIEIGGDSLKAIRVIARIYKVFGVEVSVRDFFAAPTIRELARFVDAGRQKSYQPIPALADAERYELSHAQRRLWLLDQMEKNSPAYNIASSFLIEGPLSVVNFAEAIRIMHNRHESLRTTFAEVDGLPFQKVATQSVPAFTVLDLSVETDPEQAGRDRFKSEAALLFDLSRGPLYRVSLLKLDQERTVFIFVIHHIISDVWSLGVMTTELSLLYNALQAGGEPELPLLAIQYRDYAAWQNASLADGNAIASDRAYWLETLAAPLPTLDLPVDFPRPVVKTHAGATITFHLEPNLAGQLRGLAAERGASLFALLVALVRVLVHRYTGQEDLVIGTPVAGRTHPDLEPQIGFFLNTLALRDQTRSGDCFTDLLARVMATNTAAFDHQGYPFDRLVDDLELPRDVSRSPVFDLMVVLQNAGQTPFNLAGTNLREFMRMDDISKFDLDFVFQEVGEEIEVLLEYNRDLFEPERMRRMARHFTALAEGVAARPDRLIRDLPLLSPEELYWIQHDFNDTAATWPQEATIASLFQRQAQLTPDRAAVTFQGETITYAALNQEAKRIAQLIRVTGVGPGEIVALISEPSLLMPAQLMGILQAGCCYLPIDPSYPEERVRFMLDDSGASLVLAQAAALKRFSGLGAAVPGTPELVLLDKRKTPPAGPSTNAGSGERPAPADAAYIIYTSGSTGRPKGVVVEHRNVVRLLFNDRLPFEFTGDDVWIQSHSFCFDFSVWEMYGALLRGGRLVIPLREEVRDIARYAEIVREERVTVLNQTPAAFYGFIQQALEQGHDWGEHLRYVIFGGDRLEPAYLRPWAERFPAVALINMYGITETTVHVTFLRLTAEELADSGRSPIGRPIPETTIYVCDPAMNLQPMGVPGEIYVGGSGVSRGYLNLPELTAERFIADPFRPGGRLYKTGDLGRWTWGGGLEYLGRNDQQVQIRGFRVELGEIESRLLEHPAVKECVVLAMEGEQHSLCLAAWIVFNREITVTTLRKHLAEKLAEYMIPAWFTPMEKLPLTSNGKLDRKGLPDPRHEPLRGLDLGSDHVAPRTETERIVATVWEGVLGRQGIGIHDNYFALGGDSIRAIQVISRLQQQGLKAEMLDVFQFPTVAGLSGRVMAVHRRADQGAVVGSIPLTPVQQWFFTRQRQGLQHYNQAILLGSAVRLDEQALQLLLCALVEHHDALRIGFTQAEMGWQQENRPVGRSPRFEMVDLSAEQDPTGALERHAASVQAGFHLDCPPLVAAVLYRLADGDRLLIVIHHLVVDGVSWRILAEDLFAGYTRLIAGEPLEFPLKSDSFKLWSERLGEYAADEGLLKEMEYWQAIASTDAAPVPLLPPPHNRWGTSADFEDVALDLNPEETLQLLTRANQTYHTDAADLMLTALAHALHDWTGSRRHLITLEGHGREEIGRNVDISRTVGWFTTLFPHLLELAERDDPGYQLRVVKEGVRAVPNHGLGYGVLDRLTPDHLKQGTVFPPLPRISFNYLGTFDADFGSGPFFPAPEGHGDIVGPAVEASFDLEFTCSVMSGKLSVNLRHDRRLMEAECARRLAHGFLQHLRLMISHCCGVEDAVITPSDISYDGLDIDQLDSLLEGLGT